MKKISKKALLMATVFTAALNMNGCAYGPPPEEDMYYSETQVMEKQLAEVSEEQSKVEVQMEEVQGTEGEHDGAETGN